MAGSRATTDPSNRPMEAQENGVDDALIPELGTRWREFDDAKQKIDELVAGLDRESYNRRAEKGSWSMAECVDHLLQVGGRMIPVLERSIERGRSKGRLAEGPFRYSAFGNWFATAIGGDQLPPPKRFKVPRIYVPSPGLNVPIEDSVRSFKELQGRYQRLILQAQGLDLARVKARSPAFWPLRLSLGVWFRLLAGHQRRHLWQAARARRRVADSGE